jgi:hypothetical protein
MAGAPARGGRSLLGRLVTHPQGGAAWAIDFCKREGRIRRIIAALQVSVDGFIQGPNGELDWAMAEDEETWREVFDTVSHVDTFIIQLLQPRR